MVEADVQEIDWGARSPRWAGIRSETLKVGGTSVHYLRAEAGANAPADAPTHLLVHPMAAGGTFMLDLIGPLTAFGPVIAPDLPGSIFGHTVTPRHRAARLESSATFLRAFTGELGLERVIVHGWSMGGTVAMKFAAASPDRVGRVVLANPTLPARLTARQWLGWQTLGRLAVLVGPPLARGLVRLWGPPVIDRKLAALGKSEKLAGAGGDLSRIPAESVKLWTEQLADLRAHPQLMGAAAAAFASATAGMFIHRRRTLHIIDGVMAPVLLLWGDQDPLIERAMIDDILARRPDWEFHLLESAGHMAPLEMPEDYAEAVGRWLRDARRDL
jgi:pimeloyl-ACP methyl ester carboxylesterase